jgi:HEAT repeat protein
MPDSLKAKMNVTPKENSVEPPLQEEDIKNVEDRGDVKGLISLPKHRDIKLRSAAAEALCKVGNEQAVTSLIETLLKDEEWVVRRYAAEALGNIGTPQVVEPLTIAFNNDPFVCDITGRRVVRIVAEEALKKIMKAKTATEPLDRLLACQWSDLSLSSNVNLLIDIIKRNCESISDRDVSKCIDAIKELAKEKAPVVAEVMCYSALAANHYNVRDYAANVLKGITRPEITQILCDALHYDREVYRPVDNALKVLKIIGDQNATSAILNFLNDFCNTWRIKGDIVSVGMASAMTIGAYLNKEKSICLSACRALSTLGGSKAITALESVLSDSYWGNYNEIQEELPELIAQAKR